MQRKVNVSVNANRRNEQIMIKYFLLYIYLSFVLVTVNTKTLCNQMKCPARKKRDTLPPDLGKCFLVLSQYKCITECDEEFADCMIDGTLETCQEEKFKCKLNCKNRFKTKRLCYGDADSSPTYEDAKEEKKFDCEKCKQDCEKDYHICLTTCRQENEKCDYLRTDCRTRCDEVKKKHKSAYNMVNCSFEKMNQTVT